MAAFCFVATPPPAHNAIGRGTISPMNPTHALNRWLDRLPRPRFGVAGREVPTFRTCGVVGFHVALITLFGGGLLAGRSLVVLAGLALVSGLSFYAYTYLRRWITGREELVLLEHVWFALACCAAALRLAGEPVLPYLDVVSVALCPFLAAGRVGCTLVGCCHGRPSSVGIAYPESCARDGFAGHLVGVRLLPVPAIEAAGLLGIGAVGLVALPFATPGQVLAWYLLAYAVMRFGLEGLRGDRRPHWLGLSQARWMAVVEAALALELGAGDHRVPAPLVYGVLVVTLGAVLVGRWHRDLRRRVLDPAHVQETRALARDAFEAARRDTAGPPVARTSSLGVSVVASTGRPPMAAARAGEGDLAHVSLSLPPGSNDLALLCALAARGFPGQRTGAARFTGGRVLHLGVPPERLAQEPDGAGEDPDGEELYGSMVRRLQQGIDNGNPFDAAPAAEPPVSAWYFADRARGGGR